MSDRPYVNGVAAVLEDDVVIPTDNHQPPKITRERLSDTGKAANQLEGSFHVLDKHLAAARRFLIEIVARMDKVAARVSVNAESEHRTSPSTHG